MNLISLFKNISPFVRPYRWLVLVTLILTLIGSLIAQVNAVVLDRTVDAVNALVGAADFTWARAARILTIISIVLLGKEIISAVVTYCQHYFGERMRIFVSKDMSQAVIDKMLTFRMAFFSRSENATGQLQTRIELWLEGGRAFYNNTRWGIPVDGSSSPNHYWKNNGLTVAQMVLEIPTEEAQTNTHWAD